jgi:hypothetical protein
VFGVVLTATFQAQFRQDVSPETRAAVAAETLQKFEDPTLVLDQRTFEQVRSQVLTYPDGSALLADARRAQQYAISAAIHRVFLLSVGIVFLTLLLALLLKERPLQKTFGTVGADKPVPETRPSTVARSPQEAGAGPARA